MCLTTEKQELKIARKDIVAFKYVKIEPYTQYGLKEITNTYQDTVKLTWKERFLGKKKINLERKISYKEPGIYTRLVSPYQNTKLNFNNLIGATLGIQPSNWDGLKYLKIEEGYHACKQMTIAHSDNVKTFVCIIPKGSVYAEGTEGDIVSNFMVILNIRSAGYYENTISNIVSYFQGHRNYFIPEHREEEILREQTNPRYTKYMDLNPKVVQGKLPFPEDDSPQNDVETETPEVEEIPDPSTLPVGDSGIEELVTDLDETTNTEVEEK